MEWTEGMKVEFRSENKAFDGSCLEGTVKTPRGRGARYSIELDNFRWYNGEALVEKVHQDNMRPIPPQTPLPVPLPEGLFVEAYDKDCWWRGFVVRRLFCGEEFWLVHFPESKSLTAYRVTDLRRAQDWNGGSWTLV